MKNFNRENFFNEQLKKYPDVIVHFFEWLSKYEYEVGWDKLFQPNIEFVDLPIEMQRGIMELYLDQFEGDNGAVSLGLVPNEADDSELEQWAEIIQELEFNAIDPELYKTPLSEQWRIIPNL